MRVVVSGETSFRELNALVGNADGWVFAGTAFDTQVEAAKYLDSAERSTVALFWSVPVLCEDGSTVPDTPLDYTETIKRVNRRILDLHRTAEEGDLEEANMLRSYVIKLAKYYGSTPKRLYALVSTPDTGNLLRE